MTYVVVEAGSSGMTGGGLGREVFRFTPWQAGRNPVNRTRNHAMNPYGIKDIKTTRARRPPPRTQPPVDEHAATELQLYVENDGELYRRQGEPILRNLEKKVKKGTYDHDKAVKLYGYLVESSAKMYVKEFGSGESGEWYRMFDVLTRRVIAERLARNFEAEVRAQGGMGNVPANKNRAATKKKSFKAGDYVAGGSTRENYDRGTVLESSHGDARVAWQSGTTTWSPTSGLKKVRRGSPWPTRFRRKG